ncbi:uncharacterized protein METZ01_LOCUS358303, partial [marine metagenome]
MFWRPEYNTELADNFKLNHYCAVVALY